VQKIKFLIRLEILNELQDSTAAHSRFPKVRGNILEGSEKYQ
jgi:hypothetical protein